MINIITLLLIYTSALAANLDGEATSPDGKIKIYSEKHNLTVDDKGLNKKIETKYYNPKGEIFAEMTSDFSKDPTIPVVKFTDKRFEKTEELNLDKEKKIVTFKSTLGNKNPKEKEIKLKDGMVAAQGFDNFIKINFEKLLISSVSLSFGVLSEMDFFSFSAYKKKEEAHVVQFGIKLSSFFLRIFSNELVLEYDLKSKQILSYQGLSNILTDQGKTQEVLIKYTVGAGSAKP